MEHDHNRTFQQTNCLHGLDPQRIELLTTLAKELSAAPQEQKMQVFMNIMQTARDKNLNFTPSEQDLLFASLTEHMTVEEKKKAMFIRNLAAQIRKKQNQ